MQKFKLNDKQVEVNVPDDTPLLWVVREEIGLRGTKFGCGMGLCGSCTMHVNGEPTRTCILPVSTVRNAKVETIEHQDRNGLHPVQQAWKKYSVAQCGYCQSGQVMQAIGLLEKRKRWKESELIAEMNGNLCRCGTYSEIKTAVLEAAQKMGRLS